MTDRELLQMALDALEYCVPSGHGPRELYDDAIEALRARLAQPEPEQLVRDLITHGMAISKGGERIDPTSIYKQPEQEPQGGYRWREGDVPPSMTYTAPPQREWVGLNPKEISEIAFLCRSENPSFFAHAVEAKLKEKNYD